MIRQLLQTTHIRVSQLIPVTKRTSEGDGFKAVNAEKEEKNEVREARV